jgi:hypothetical protein
VRRALVLALALAGCPSGGDPSDAGVEPDAPIAPDAGACTGAVAAWDLAALPGGPVESAAIAATATHVYLAGGFDGAALDRVLSAPILADGAIDLFAPETATLPMPREHAAAVIAGDRLCVIGGDDGVAPRAEIFCAAILPTGAIGAWDPTRTLPSPRSTPLALVASGHVLLAGGTADFTTAIDDLLVAPIIAAGLGDFRAAGTLDVSDTFLAGASLADRLWIFDGTAIHGGHVATDGTVTWGPLGSLATASFGRSAAIVRGRVFVLGGLGSAAVASSPIETDGALGAFEPTLDLPEPRAGAAAIGAGSHLHVAGGLESLGVPRATVYSARACE